MSKWTFLVPALCLILGCGSRPSARTTIQARGEPKTAQSSNSDAVKPDTKPAPQKSPETARVAPTTAEIADARETYTNVCSICHGALAQSSKRGVTLSRLTAASVPMAVPLHTDVLREGKWPFDVVDDTADGVDTAVLRATALVEALK